MPLTYFSRLRNVVGCGIQRSILGQDSVEVLVVQGKLCCGNSRFFNSIAFSIVPDAHALLQPGTVCSSSSDVLCYRKKNLSVVGALYRTFSVPSVSVPPFHVCGYHFNRSLVEASQISGNNKFQSKLMATCDSKVAIRECYMDSLISRPSHLSSSTNNAGIACSNRILDRCMRAPTSLKDHEQPNNHLIHEHFISYIAKSRFSFDPFMPSKSKYFHSSSCTIFATGTADVPFDGSTREEHVASSAVSSDQKIPARKTLKLLSGSCYLPHPDKEETGGEDAHFICVNEQAIGVADGVGGWADLGVDSGQYSRELMSNSVKAIHEEPRGSIDPAGVLEKAHSSTKAKGSSTACILALTDQGIHAINLGDSGFMVIRDGCTIFRSPVQQHDFNFTYQLESGSNGDLPSSGQVFTVPVAPGDVIVLGTDGLFDNLYNNEITAVVVHASRTGIGPQVTAQKIAALARQRAQDKDRQTPFSTAAQEAGFRYYGGKLDDVTVVVSYITGSNDA